jgi:lysyl endopeptidase
MNPQNYTSFKAAGFILLLLFPFGLLAQRSLGGLPFLYDGVYPDLADLEVPVYELPTPDLEPVRRLNAQHPDNPLVSTPVSVDWSPSTAGQWVSLNNGGRVWVLRVRIHEAQGLAFFYDSFQLPEGSRLFMYTPDGRHILGGYSAANNSRTQTFMSGFTQGEEVILEYYLPAWQPTLPGFHIHRMDFGFDPSVLDETLNENRLMFGFGASNGCHENAECPLGDEYPDARRSTCRVRLVVEEGTGWCSGVLVNNTAEDGTPYILTGYHCQDGFTPLYDMWRFDFNYQSVDCDDPANEPSFQSLLGCELRAGRQESDFLLVELFNPIPYSYNAHFSGWDWSGVAPDTGIHFHHPRADIKKVSADFNSISVFTAPLNWNNNVTTPANHHFEAILDEGSFELGSSGGPLFDAEQRVVGQLHGGILNCNNAVTYFGRFSMSWDQGTTPATRLKEWLDPGDTGVTTLDGFDLPASGSIAGKVITEWGEGVAGVTVVLAGGAMDTVVTDTSGNYAFTDLAINQPYTVTFVKDTLVENGVSTLDLVGIMLDILNVQLLPTPYKIIAADANHSESVSTLDRVAIQRVILDLDQSFQNNTSWRFVATDYVFMDPEDPLAESFPEALDISNLTSDLTDQNFYGLKVGDVNETADPKL